ncbi:MAG: efflux RND transporter periplasmic adaptor subunit [Bacteroidetes bacterium]|nr:MAG: efflux RND transporter periplasmic adaptor subunit [Bacteroidota bacterium]
MKKPLLLIGCGILVIATILGIKSCSNSGSVEITTENVQRRTIIETVSANGKIQPEVQLKISSDVSGEIVELMVKEGDHVNKGDLLVKIKPEIYQSAVDRANAAVSSSQSNIENAKAQLAQVKAQFANAEAAFNRSKKLFDQGAVSQAEFDNSKASYESAKAQVESAEEGVKSSIFNVNSAQAGMKEATENLNKTSIFAAVSGTVSKLSKEKGERVVGTSMMEGSEIMILANLNEMEVSVDVNENDIVRVHLSDTADIQVDAYMERKFKGIITEIANSANTSGVMADQVTNFTVKIRILQDSYKDLMNAQNPNLSPFRPGMSATVDIHTKKAKNVLSLPIQAVTTRSDSAMKSDKEKEDMDDYNTKAVDEKKEKIEMNSMKDIKPQECVFIYADGKVKLQKVKTGIQDNTAIEITEGLKEDDEIVNGPYNAVAKILKNGMEVKKADKTDIANSWKKE